LYWLNYVHPDGRFAGVVVVEPYTPLTAGDVLIQSAGLPKIDDVDRDRPDEDGHPVLKIDPEKGEVLAQEFEKCHRAPPSPSRPAVQNRPAG
jgi:hypothetical protein